jgi:hypothetical protein
MNFSALTRLASGHVEARIVQVAVDLALFDCLAERPLRSADVASKLGLDLPATTLLLDALTALTLLEKTGGTYALSTAARTYLVNTSPQSLCGMIRFEGSLWDDWARLAEAVRSGKPSRAPNMYQERAEETARFIAAMDSLVKARGDAEILGATLDLQGVTRLLDVGSGPATYPIHLCRRWSTLRVTVFDLPGTLALTQRYVRAAGLAERFTLVPGNYRKDDIPGQYQTIFLSNIIHGEGAEQNAKLIAKLAGNLEPGGRIIIKDHILDSSLAHPPVGAIFSLLMLLTTESGRCYSLGEITGWLESAGLKHATQIQLPEPLTSSLVVAEK